MSLRLPASARCAALSVLLAGPAAAADVDWAQAKRVDEVTRGYKFRPAHLQFAAGVAYRLHLANPSKETHEFHAPAFFAAVTLRDPAILNAERSEIVLQPGEQKDAYFVARQPGHYKLICPDHDWAGMTGEITIK
jgi:uncharacterized cupredoxin-like copper-binding protein